MRTSLILNRFAQFQILSILNETDDGKRYEVLSFRTLPKLYGKSSS
jgi:hypothetical protein